MIPILASFLYCSQRNQAPNWGKVEIMFCSGLVFISNVAWKVLIIVLTLDRSRWQTSTFWKKKNHVFRQHYILLFGKWPFLEMAQWSRIGNPQDVSQFKRIVVRITHVHFSPRIHFWFVFYCHSRYLSFQFLFHTRIVKTICLEEIKYKNYNKWLIRRQY